jgi:hypothetical protein
MKVEFVHTAQNVAGAWEVLKAHNTNAVHPKTIVADKMQEAMCL